MNRTMFSQQTRTFGASLCPAQKSSSLKQLLLRCLEAMLPERCKGVRLSCAVKVSNSVVAILVLPGIKFHPSHPCQVAFLTVSASGVQKVLRAVTERRVLKDATRVVMNYSQGDDHFVAFGTILNVACSRHT